MGFVFHAASILASVILIFQIENIALLDWVNFFCITSSLALTNICLAAIVLRQLILFDVIESIENHINKSNLQLLD